MNVDAGTTYFCQHPRFPSSRTLDNGDCVGIQLRWGLPGFGLFGLKILLQKSARARSSDMHPNEFHELVRNMTFIGYRILRCKSY
jgi:hypothetical protein